VNYCQWVTSTPDCACAEWPCPHQTTCGRPAMNKWEGKWFCEEHYDDMLELEAGSHTVTWSRSSR
jgi:hypothetical protein